MFAGVDSIVCCGVELFASLSVVIDFPHMFLGAKFFVSVGLVTQIWRLKSRLGCVFNGFL